MGDSINIDFSPLAKTADPVGNYVNAFKVGRDLAGEKIASNAMQAYGADPTAPIDPRLFAADPKTALALQGQQRDEQTRQANIKTATALASGNTDQAMQAAAATGDISTITHVHEWARQAHEDQVKAASERLSHIATISMGLKTLPPEQRLPAAQHMADLHPEYGIKSADLTAEQFTDDGIQSSINETLGAKGALEHELEVRKQAHTEAKDTTDAAETVRNHNLEHRDRQVTQGIEGAHLALDRQKFSADEAHRVSLSPGAIQLAAEQVIAGNGADALRNLGRGNQGRADLDAVRNAVADIASVRHLNGQDLANINAAFAGQRAGAVVLGKRGAQLDQTGGALEGMVGLSKEAYNKLPREQFVPFNKLHSLVDRNLSSPQQAAAYQADEAVINAWARSINPTGSLTVSDTNRGEAMLSKATSHAAHDATLDMMLQEVAKEKGATAQAKANNHGGSAPAAPAHGHDDDALLAKWLNH